MLFIPFRADIGLLRIPFLTILICIACLVIYYGQHSNEKKVVTASEKFCQTKGPVMWRMVLQRTNGESSTKSCLEMMWEIHISDDTAAEISKYSDKGTPIAGMTKASDKKLKYGVIEARYKSFTRSVPQYDTKELWYQPASWDVWAMITSSFSHGSWDHVIGNLFFFFAFSATVEIILGSIGYLGVILILSLGTNAFYSLIMMARPDAMPTVGLSGVVMGVMALFVYLMPTGKIRCFIWFLLFIRIISVPAWILAGWYIGWDVYELLSSDEMSGINLIAHVSGAAIGYLTGVILFRKQRQQTREDLADMKQSQQDNKILAAWLK